MINYKPIHLFLSFFLFFSFACKSPTKNDIGDRITGKVISVKDGDTIDVVFENEPLTIRFAHIDCPEKRTNQPFGNAAKKFTSDLCFGQIVTIENEQKFDRYGRLIGVVINENGLNVNKELLKAGLAWHYKKYSDDDSYAELENIARQSKLGLWVEANPIPPWEWR